MKSLSRVVTRCLWALMSLLMTGMFILFCLYFYMTIHLPDVSKIQHFHLQSPMRVYTHDGKLIGEFGHKRRQAVQLERVPLLLIQAILATEDQRFFKHSGVDFIGLLRASYHFFLTGRRSQGASTITMQVARNFFLTPEKTFTRKINEILLALKIESKLTKKQILELYLNKVFLGNRAYGVAAAAYTYYGKPLDELGLPELAMIAGLPRSPSRDNPVASPHNAAKRRKHVLTRLLKHHVIDEPTYFKAVAAPVVATYHGVKPVVHAPYVAEMVRQELFKEMGEAAYTTGLEVYTTIDARLQEKANKTVQQGLLNYTQRHGYRGPEMNLAHLLGEDKTAWQVQLEDIDNSGPLEPAAVTEVRERTADVLLADGRVVTLSWSALSWARLRQDNGKSRGPAPEQASDIVKRGDVIRVMKSSAGWVMTQRPEIQSALVSLRAKDGAIVALVGGFSHEQSHFNRAIQAQRQPGSAFKPFIYAAALSKGYTLASVFNDSPVVLNDYSGEEVLWRPKNHTGQFQGPTRLREGLVTSRNLVSVRLLRDLGIPYTLDYIKRFGLNPDKQPHTLSLALGTGAVSPLELTQAYAPFANGGYYVSAYFIDHIKNAKGKVIYQAHPLTVMPDSSSVSAAVTPSTYTSIAHTLTAASSDLTPAAPRVLEPRLAYLIRSVLQDVVLHGTGRPARVLKRTDIAGKTGSTNDLMDAWFAGFNNDIVTTVWVGFDKKRSVHEYAVQVALPLWIDFMGEVIKEYPFHAVAQPSGIVTVRIDPTTGLLASPNEKEAIFEMFREEKVPKAMTTPSSPMLFLDEPSEDQGESLFSE